MKRTKYDKYRCIYDCLRISLLDIPDKKIKKLLYSWSISLNQIDEWLSDSSIAITKSQLAAGLEQGLIETYYLFFDISDEYKAVVFTIFSECCAEYEVNVLERLDDKCNKILLKGRIRNETEWHLIRSKVDELSFLKADNTIIDKFQQLLDQFEL